MCSYHKSYHFLHITENLFLKLFTTEASIQSVNRSQTDFMFWHCILRHIFFSISQQRKGSHINKSSRNSSKFSSRDFSCSIWKNLSSGNHCIYSSLIFHNWKRPKLKQIVPEGTLAFVHTQLSPLYCTAKSWQQRFWPVSSEQEQRIPTTPHNAFVPSSKIPSTAGSFFDLEKKPFKIASWVNQN